MPEERSTLPQSPACGREIREQLGQQLRAYYVVTQQIPLPAKLTDLIEHLSQPSEEKQEPE
jgi:hypothetical protein